MLRVSKKLIGLLCLLYLTCFTSDIWSGVTGKISGIIMDSKTDEPVIGATVRILGTNMATKTDMDGEYFVINVPSGKYDISVTSVGFETVVKKEVRVLVDLTTPVDFSLKQVPVELGQKMVVYAENPIIQKDLTASKVIFTSDRLKTLPNIVTIQSVLTNYPGVVVDRDNALHVRGGRSNQVAYYYDGFNVQDPFISNSGIHIIPQSLEELTLTSGGYTAEYGEALSGVVSAVTREGGANYKGTLRMYEGYTQPYDIYSGSWGELNRIGNKAASFHFSGPIPRTQSSSNTFSVAGEYQHDPSSLPHNGAVRYTGTAKVSVQPTTHMRLIGNAAYYDSYGEIYEHRDVNGVSYDFNLDGLPSFEKQSYLLGMSGNYHFNEKVILSSRFNHFYTYTHQAPTHLMNVHWRDWPGYSEDSNGVYNGTIDNYNYLNDVDYSDPSQVVGFTSDDDFNPTYRYREAKYNAYHLSLVNQVNKYNQVKAGFEYRFYDINWDFKQFFNEKPYGETYSSKPKYLSLFLQDKMEYEFYVVNLGLRYDYRNDDITYNTTPGALTATYERAESTSKLSPRLGVSFPITEKSVMHFNYGVYYQVPQFTYLYTNLMGDVSSGYPLLGNPNLEPERTISYELGIDHLLGENLRLDVTAYYKDVKDLVTTVSTFEVAGNSVTSFRNDAYGSVKGIDINIEKLPGNRYLSGSISYSYMIAKGNGSYALEPYYTFITTTTADSLAPVSEYALDFDQRHTVTGVIDFRVPYEWNADLFGLKVPGGWGFNFVGHYGTGLPYTLTDRSGNRLGERNEGRLPANYTVDMRFNKDLRLKGARYLMSFFVEVDNLFNNRNVINVYSLTGRADDDGFNQTSTLALNQQELDKYDALYDHDPQNFSPPRTIRTGLEINF